MGKTKEELRREFNEFARKISQLEAFRKELDSFNVKGFENEVRAIRARLKDVNSVSWIKTKMNELKRKIEDKARRTGQISSKVLKETKRIEKDTEGIKRRIKQLEDLLEKRKALSSKKVLSREESEAIRDIPKIENELRTLRVEIEAHMARHKVKIDSGVGTLVDSKFDDFIDEIKSELSERVREKEEEERREVKEEQKEMEHELGKEKRDVEKELKGDLERRKDIFEKKYKEVVNDFHDRYKKKVHEELHKEVSKDFNEQLNKRLREEKHKVITKLIDDNAKELHDKKRDLVSKLEGEYSKKNKRYEEKVKGLNRKRSDLDEEKRRLERRFNEEFRKKMDALAKEKKTFKISRVSERAESGKKLSKQKMKIEKERNRVLGKLDAVKRRVKADAERRKQRVNRQYLARKKKIDVIISILEKERERHERRFNLKINLTKEEMHKELMRRALRLERNSAVKLGEEVSKRERMLRAQLNREYADKAKAEMRKNQAKLEAKKDALQKHILEQARKLLD